MVGSYSNNFDNNHLTATANTNTKTNTNTTVNTNTKITSTKTTNTTNTKTTKTTNTSRCSKQASTGVKTTMKYTIVFFGEEIKNSKSKRSFVLMRGNQNVCWRKSK